MTNGDERQKETLSLKVFGGAVMTRTERKKNEGLENGEERGEMEGRGREGSAADSSIIEGNLAAAAERTMASFYPASVCDFLVDVITVRFSWRSESLPAAETFCPSPFLPLKSHLVMTLQDAE